MRPPDKLRRFLRSAWEAGSEILLALAVVLLLSSLLLGSLQLLFPEGTGLVDLYGGFVERRDSARRPEFSKGAEQQTVVARLSQVQRQVKDRPEDAVIWSNASAGMPVQHRHAIQTLGRSTATISIEHHDDIELAANSLVVFRQPEPGAGQRKRRASVTVMGGRIRGSIAPERGATQSVDIMTANAAARFTSDGDRPADYSVTVGPDNSSVVALYAGSGEVEVGEQKARLEPNEALTVFPDMTIGPTRPLPVTPALLAPADDAVTEFAENVPDITFEWEPVAAAENYRLEIALDPGFEQVTYEAVHAEPAFTHASLVPGEYYWRVTALAGALESRPTAARQLSLVKDGEAPRLAVELLPDPSDDTRVVLRGTTEPGARVFVGDEDVNVTATGEFSFVAVLRPGVNLITVEAVDAVGNSAYFSEYVNPNAIPTRTP